MKIDILTIFPDFVDSIKTYSIIARAIDKGLAQINFIDIRDFSKDKHKKVDDYPYGGGPGMVMTPQPLDHAIESVKTDKTHLVYMSPRGKVFDQAKAKNLARLDHLAILCGHYEGIDQRIIQNHVDEEISLGDYILTGGDLGAMVLVDAVIRLLDGVLGNDESRHEESFENYLLEYDQYTRPQSYKGHDVPPVLLSGNHQAIEEYRKEKSIEITKQRRPDLYKKYMDQVNK